MAESKNLEMKSNRKVTSRRSVVTQKLGHDHSSELKRLSRIKGQVEGVERMIIDKRYCPEIVNQIKAIRSALKSLEANVIEGHMRSCVNQAIKSRDPIVVQEKLDEIVSLMKGQGL